MPSAQQRSWWSKLARARWWWFVTIAALALVAGIGLRANSQAWGAHSSAASADPITPGPNLIGSYKVASQNYVISGQLLTYTIHLRNFGTTQSVASVTDPLPNEVTYVPGSATQGGVYDGATKTLAWGPLTVTQQSDVKLSFAVTAASVTSPTLVANTATITGGNEPLKRSAWVVVIPASMVSPNLERSAKYASRNVVGAGEAVTFKINLVNSGLVAATASVTDPLPVEMNYVSGSATGGGVYDSGARTLSWSNVNVPAWGHVTLSFVTTATTTIVSPTLVTNTASIASGGQSFDRRALVIVIPHPLEPPRSILAGSHKTASRRRAEPGETLTYRIKLINSGETDALANVTDPVPPEMTYIPGSASNNGVYDPSTRTLSWDAISVSGEGEDDDGVALSFSVMATTTITQPTWVTNTATISVTGDGSFNRQALVKLVPAPSGDVIPPEVHSVTIDDQDVLTSPTVTLHISATDNISVSQMFIREWQLTSSPFPHWSIAQSSGWVPYQADYPWTLSSRNGVHYVGVWAADAAQNISELDRNAIDFASLILPNATVERNGFVPYLVYYPAGVHVTAQITPTVGDADLYLWHPGNFLSDDGDTESLTASKIISFTTPRAGTYVFVVRGQTAATYDLSIDPAGGPRAGSPQNGNMNAVDLSAPEAITAPAGALKLEPILSQSGLDPLATAPQPDSFNTVYLPLILR